MFEYSLLIAQSYTGVCELTAGIAAKNFHRAERNFGRLLVMIALSIIVAFWIIQMSDTDRRMSEAAMPIKSPVSALHFFGMIMPRK